LADIYTKAKRSQIMSSISGKETKPEKKIRSYLFIKGIRFRKNVKILPGKPDILLPKYKVVIFFHGCFWHGHSNCKKAARPTTNIEFWNTKIQSNIDRDERVKLELETDGWRIITIWSCEVSNKNSFETTMAKLIDKIYETKPKHKSTHIKQAHKTCTQS